LRRSNRSLLGVKYESQINKSRHNEHQRLRILVFNYIGSTLHLYVIHIMKVTIYSGSIPTTVFIERLIKGLANRGVIVSLYGPKRNGYRHFNHNIKVTGYSGKVGKLYILIKYFTLLLLFRPTYLWKLLRHYYKGEKTTGLNNFLVKAAPIIFHKPDVFHLQWAKALDDWMFLQDFGIKMVLSLRGAHINYSPVADAELAKMYCRNFPNVDAFHAVSEAIAVEAGKYGCPPVKTKVIYSGLDPEAFKFSHKIDHSTGNFRIISIGRSHWIKGYSYSIDACKLLADKNFRFTYTIIGGISEELQFQVHQLRLDDQVKLLPSLPFDDTMRMLADSDVLLLPSLEEGIANVVLEAMAVGVPVISTRCGGMEEAIEHNINGFLVDPRNPPQIAESVVRISQMEDTEKLNIIREARTTIVQKFSRSQMIDGMIKLYKDTLTSPIMELHPMDSIVD